jgi:hypothetical protein
MEIELIGMLLLVISALAAALVLLPKRSSTPSRRITSSKNGYGRGWGR